VFGLGRTVVYFDNRYIGRDGILTHFVLQPFVVSKPGDDNFGPERAHHSNGFLDARRRRHRESEPAKGSFRPRGATRIVVGHENQGSGTWPVAIPPSAPRGAAAIQNVAAVVIVCGHALMLPQTPPGSTGYLTNPGG
jgi:hypothetical protein